MGIAFTMYGRLEEADPLVSSLCADKDPILRRSGMYTLAMAYCGTGNNQAIRKLLHVAVSFHKAKLLSLSLSLSLSSAVFVSIVPTRSLVFDLPMTTIRRYDGHSIYFDIK